MRGMSAFCQVTRDFSSVADFLLIYIDEAHPVGSWNPGNIEKHKDLSDRLQAANEILPYQAEGDFDIVVDAFTNDAMTAYGAMPEKWYIIDNGKLAYCGKMSPFYYRLDDIQDWLKDYQTQKGSL